MDYWDIVEKHKLQVSPIIGKRRALLYWTCGFRSLAGNGWTNLVLSNEFTKGKTAKEAIRNLVKKMNLK